MTEYFFNLTKWNWGFTYHIILACMLYLIVFVIHDLLDKNKSRVLINSFLIVTSIGIFNELVIDGIRPDMFSDLFANLLGCIIFLMMYFGLKWRLKA